jgi:hypothetical protein
MNFMSDFARYLVAAGITSSRFTRLARLAFFSAASESAKFANNRVNSSAVAAMTGLTRVQVRNFARAERTASKGRADQIDRVVRGWNSDSAFTTSDQSPRPLTTSGKDAGFSQLVRRYGGDIPARSVLREMVRTGLVEVKGKYAYLNRRARLTKSQIQLHDLTQALAQLLERPAANSQHTLSLRSTVRQVTYASPSPKGRALMKRKSNEGLLAFLCELKAAGAAASIETPRPKKQKSLMTRTRVMVLTEELDHEEVASIPETRSLHL